MPIVNFGDVEEEKWLSKYSLVELQEMTKYNNSFEIIDSNIKLPLHKDCDKNYLDGEYEFKNILLDQRMYKDHLVKVSNKGRIEIDGDIKPQDHDIKKGLIIKIPGQDTPEIVHRLVALTWRDGKTTLDKHTNEYCIVHHLDGNAFNNDYENLLWVTWSQHEMIHIAGNWFKNGCQLIFKGNEFILKNVSGKIINGEYNIFGDYRTSSWIEFYSNKRSTLDFERIYFNQLILKDNVSFINNINNLIGEWKLGN
jgi:hypothetical protein